MHRIVFLDRATIAPQVRLRRPRFEHELVEHDHTGPDDVVGRLRGASVAIVNKARLPAAVLVQLPDLRLVAVAATGTDCVDKAYCREHGIAVANIRGYAIHTVPEHVFALMLALRRNIVAYRDEVIAGQWQHADQFCFFSHPIRDLAGSRLGIIGEGVLGQRVAGHRDERSAWCRSSPRTRACRAWGRSTRRGTSCWKRATSSRLHCPLTPQTRGIIAMPEFRAMKRRPLLINTARGGLVDEGDLMQALDEGHICGAGFDVAGEEPPAADGPLMRIAGRPNVIVTPHVAWASDEAQQALADQLIDNIENFVAGQPTNLVDGAY